jgi:hypothetical protein
VAEIVGVDDEARASGRQRWKAYERAGHELLHHAGGWSAPPRAAEPSWCPAHRPASLFECPGMGIAWLVQAFGNGCFARQPRSSFAAVFLEYR